MSVILREGPAAAGRATMAAALAVVRAVRQVGAGRCSIKWPNDVLAPDGRKICGILSERFGAAIVVGIGVNVNQSADDIPPELASTATSLRIMLGHTVSRLELLAAVLGELERCLAMDGAALLEAWGARCSTLGRGVRVRCAGRSLVGEALGVEAGGALVVRLASGGVETVHSGDVEELRIDGE